MTYIVDRYLLRRYIITTCALALLAALFISGFDLLLRLNKIHRLDISSYEVLYFYCARLPYLFTTIMPMLTVLSALLCIAPEIKNNSLISLSTAAVSMRKSLRVFFVAALVLGGLSVFLADQVAPRFLAITSNLVPHNQVQQESAVTWIEDSCNTVWYGHHLQDNGTSLTFQLVTIIPEEGGMVHARLMEYHNNNWVLRPPIYRWHSDDAGHHYHETLDHLPLTGTYIVPFSVAQLRDKITSRQALTGDELWSNGSHLHMSLLLSRWSRFFLPLAALFIALPLFVRFKNRDRIVSAGGIAFLASLTPIGILSIASTQADISSTPPALILGSGLILAFLPGCILFFRWHL